MVVSKSQDFMLLVVFSVVFGVVCLGVLVIAVWYTASTSLTRSMKLHDASTSTDLAKSTHPRYHIIQIVPYHHEVVVAVANVLFQHNPNSEIHIHITEDPLDFIEFYRKQYSEYQILVHREPVSMLPLSDGVIYTTARDYQKKHVQPNQPIVRIGHGKLDATFMDMALISLLHPQWATISVVWKSSYNVVTDLTPTVAVIGLDVNQSSKHKDMADIIRLIESGVRVVVFSRTVPDTMPRRDNVTYFIKTSQSFTINYLQNHNCLIWTAARKNSRYHREGLTGAVPVAISCNTPLIMDSELHKFYDLPALTYKDSVMELLHEIQRVRMPIFSIYSDFMSTQHRKFIGILQANGFTRLDE